MNVILKDLLVAYPLPLGWTEPEVTEHRFQWKSLNVNLIGLCSQNKEGVSVTGSSGDLKMTPILPAYFELLERICILEARSKKQEKFWTKSVAGLKLKSLPFDEVFPESPEPSVWTYAKSNGVALGTDFKRASENAHFELLERDQILRSWYGEFEPERYDINIDCLFELKSEYDIAVYRFGTKCKVFGVFGFPRFPNRPLVFGFGAGKTIQYAVKKATREFCQRLGFLWEEPITNKLPLFSPTPDYHQDFYLVPSQIRKIKEWLSGEKRNKPLKSAFSKRGKTKILYVDLTPSCLKGKVHVLKAYSNEMMPLTFGLGNPRLTSRLSKDILLHPIA